MATRMDDSKLRAIIDHELNQAINYGGELSDQRRKSLEYYYGEQFGNEVEGRSSVVSTDVADVIEWTLPSLLKVFTSGDRVGRFDPQGPEDTESAEQATDYCNYIFFRDNPGFQVLYDAFKDALIQKTGIFKVYWEENDKEEREEYTGLTDDEFNGLVTSDEVEVLEHTSTTVAVDIQNEEMSPEIDRVQPTLHDVALMRRTKDGRVTIEVVPPEEFYVSRQSRSMEDATFVAHRVRKTVSELTEMGVKNANELVSEDDQQYNEQTLARNEFDDALGAVEKQSIDESTRQVWVSECYMMCDYDGDNVAELRKVTKAGNRILFNEPVDRIPFTTICPIPMPHKFYGLSLSDTVMDLQLIKSTLWRNILDNIYALNNGRWGVVDGKVNMDDMLTSRPGGLVRVREPGAVFRLDTPDIGKAPYEMLGYCDQVKDARTGVTKFNQGLDPNVLQSTTATAYMQQMQSSGARLETIARIFAETGVKTMFEMIYELVQKHQQKPRVIRLRNEWVEVDPTQWQTKADMMATVGLGFGNRDQNLAYLNMFGQHIQSVVQQGGMGKLVTPKNIYNLLAEGAKNMGIKNVEDFVTNPDNPDESGMPQQEAPDPETLKAQVEMSKLQLDQQKIQLDMAKLQLEKQKMDFDAQKLQAEMVMQDKENQMKTAELQMEAYAGRPVKLG